MCRKLTIYKLEVFRAEIKGCNKSIRSYTKLTEPILKNEVKIVVSFIYDLDIQNCCDLAQNMSYFHQMRHMPILNFEKMLNITL